jgi:hypothetical protein
MASKIEAGCMSICHTTAPEQTTLGRALGCAVAASSKAVRPSRLGQHQLATKNRFTRIQRCSVTELSKSSRHSRARKVIVTIAPIAIIQEVQFLEPVTDGIFAKDGTQTRLLECSAGGQHAWHNAHWQSYSSMMRPAKVLLGLAGWTDRLSYTH